MPGAAPPPSLHDVMASTLTEALRQCEGLIHGPGGAAERLGLPPTTLQSKLGLHRRDFQP